MNIRTLSLLLIIAWSCTLSEAREFEWSIAETRVRNAVVQVWTQAASFDWLNPYRSPDKGQGAGSGYFIDNKGYLLTNYHVVAGAKSVYVTIPALGRIPLHVEIVGVCPEVDVALLRVNKESKKRIEQACGSINALELGNSDVVAKAESVLALGYPLGFPSLKITVGCVAGRDFHKGCSILHVTAPISSGNSGGPVIDHLGKVVGMTSGSFLGGQKNSAQNYNIIIPSSEVLVILPDLYKGGLVRRLSFGLESNKTTLAHARSLGCPLPTGLYVSYVFKDSLEEKAGIKVGDVLYEVEVHGAKYKLDEFGDVSVPWRTGERISVGELLVRCRAGDPLAVTLYRKGQKHRFTWTFESSKIKSIRMIYPEYEPQEIDYEIIGGLVIMQLRANHFEILLKPGSYLKELPLLGRPENQVNPALVVTSILPGSLGHLSDCFVPGFILDTVNDKKVTTLQELRDALQLSLKTGEILISTKDHSSTVFDLREVLNDEKKLSQDFIYPITPLVKGLLNSSVGTKAA